MNKLNEYDIQFLIEKLQKGESIPEDYKYKLFPVKQKEYELVYAGKMRKEDILANEEASFCALKGGAEYFLTCVDKLIKKVSILGINLKIMNPLKFIEDWG